LEKGNTGALKSLGGGLWEIKIDFRQGYRIYCVREGNTVILLLSGGIKRQQQADIKRARKIKEFYETGGNIYE
jgi:putative addiction module killer protein